MADDFFLFHLLHKKDEKDEKYMIIVMKPHASSEHVQEVKHFIENNGLTAHLSQGEEVTIIGVVGDKKKLSGKNLELLPDVDHIVPVTESYKLSNRKFHPEPSIVKVGNTEIGPNNLTIMAGPCAIESEEQLMTIARAVKKSGATILRGGAYKPRTSPYSFQGMRSEGLDLLKLARRATGSPIVTEIMNTEHVPLFADVDMIQVGARNMQNFELLKELGKLQTPVLLKRGLANTIEEFLMSAEYIMAGGNENVVLCERGIRTFETSMRNTLDISAVPMLKSKTHLPVVIDPSHAAGIAWMVEPLAMAAIAAGADGLMIEVHNDPPHAKSDGAQSLTPAQFDALMGKVKAASAFFGKAIN